MSKLHNKHDDKMYQYSLHLHSCVQYSFIQNKQVSHLSRKCVKAVLC